MDNERNSKRQSVRLTKKGSETVRGRVGDIMNTNGGEL